MPLRGDFRDMAVLKKSLRSLPITVSHEAARRIAPPITTDMRSDYRGGTDIHGAPRPLGVDGEPLTLKKSGAVQDHLHFVSDGSRLRIHLGPPYMKYLAGKYRIMPNGRSPLPLSWKERMQEETAQALDDYGPGKAR